MYKIGIDIGGTNIVGAVVDMNGEIVVKKTIPTLSERDNGLIIADIIALCKSLVGDSPSDIKSIGIGSPGIVNPEKGTVVNAANLGFDDVPLLKMINVELDYPLHIGNDANCAALGESVFGAAKGSRHSVTVTLGTGVGGGVIIDGSIYSGAFFGAGEVGHHIICIGGELCGCGMKGCWEAYASANALIRDTIKAAKDNPLSHINQLIDNDLEGVCAKTAFDAALAGDDVAIAVVERYIDYLCAGLINIINILEPQVVVIGGGVSGQGDGLIEAIEARMDKFALLGERNVKFVVAKLGNDAGVIGAAQLAEQGVLK